MDKNFLEEYLHVHIPISKAFGVSVKDLSLQKVTLIAPISNNINHKKTVFGGSLHAVATLACWSLLYINLKELLPASEIVITKSDINFLLPVTKDFEASCSLPDSTSWEAFIKQLTLKGKARLQLTAEIYQAQKQAVTYKGTFAAFNRKLC